MAGSQTLRLRGGGFVAALALSFLTFADLAWGQYPSPPAATPAGSYADFADTGAPPMGMPAMTTVPGPSYSPGVAPATTPVVMGPLGTIAESLFGKPDPDTWRPLPLSTFLSEG